MIRKRLALLVGCLLIPALPSVAQSPGLAFANRIGGTSDDRSKSIALDSLGNIYTAGSFKSTVDFDPGPGVFNMTGTSPNVDAFVSKSDNSGNFIWAKHFASPLSYFVTEELVIDASDNVIVCGRFQGTSDFDPGAGTFNLTAVGSDDGYVMKLDSSGNLVWARQLTGSGDAHAWSVAVDPAGNVYSTGYFNGTVDFDPGAPTVNLTSTFNDVFVSKLDSSGNFVWVRQLIGTFSHDIGSAITTDASGNVFTTGYFFGTMDFDPGAGTTNLTSAGAEDIFVWKLDTAGNLVWARGMGGSGDDRSWGITLDSAGNVLTTGQKSGSADFDPGAGTFNLASGADIFVSKLNSLGNFVWAKQVGDIAGTNAGNAIAVDASDDVFVTGNFSGTGDFDPGAGTHTLSGSGLGDMFATKLDAAGNFVWAFKVDSANYDSGSDIAVDTSNQYYIAGYFSDTVDIDPTILTFNLTSNGTEDSFVAKFDPTIVPSVPAAQVYGLAAMVLSICVVFVAWRRHAKSAR